MGKNTKTPPVDAPVVDNKKEEVKVEEVKNTNMPDAMTQHDKVLYASVIQHRKDEMLRTGGESANKYTALTMIEDAMLLDIALTEAIVKRNPAGVILSINEQNYTMLQLLGEGMGVVLPDYKTLPKPTKAQLKQVGLEAAPGQVVLKLEAKNVSSETKKKVSEQVKLNEDAASGKKEYLTDHTKIQTDEQLKEALGFQLVNNKITSPLDRLITTAQFYRAYLEARAEKSDNAEVELGKIHELSLADLLQEISTMVPPSFTAEGFGRLLTKRITDTKSVVPAFELLKRCGRKRNSKEFKFSDEEIAAFVRVLVVWKASAEIAALGATIKRLSKDANKNAEGIDKANADIKNEQDLMAYVTNPNFDLADNFIAAYNNKDNELHHSAVEAAKSIVETYYKDIEIPELENDALLLNIQQHIGIDLNLFNAIDMHRDEYDASNLIEFGVAAKSEETPKNA